MREGDRQAGEEVGRRKEVCRELTKRLHSCGEEGRSKKDHCLSLSILSASRG